MKERISEDLAEMEKKLNLYVEKGRLTGSMEVRNEPVIAEKPDKSKIKPLKKMRAFDGNFLAVDCSTRTLKRANNWGIYLMRAAYASVKERSVDWSFNERMCTVVGDARVRRDFLHDFRIEMESQIALSLLTSESFQEYYAHPHVRSIPGMTRR